MGRIREHPARQQPLCANAHWRSNQSEMVRGSRDGASLGEIPQDALEESCRENFGSPSRLLENSGHGAAHYCEWLNERGYRSTDWVPHDARVRVWSSGRARLETLRAMGHKPGLYPITL